jgi:hypothetical protein
MYFIFLFWFTSVSNGDGAALPGMFFLPLLESWVIYGRDMKRTRRM